MLNAYQFTEPVRRLVATLTETGTFAGATLTRILTFTWLSGPFSRNIL